MYGFFRATICQSLMHTHKSNPRLGNVWFITNEISQSQAFEHYTPHYQISASLLEHMHVKHSTNTHPFEHNTAANKWNKF